ncbi:tRNA (N6-threonylcarbamoyladenosine(37)-N6)-methyltransferase TrmO [Moraxella catarrhalis]|uniref:tRNA (N6-threonylcarbamoyladenosine(37)-N6)-methyltransferase TrmO n=1 Tax=Moraxella catarrhalis TaxID=480 RepID=UPI00128DB1B9|nr:tRNA (N6-threonylcarbamoyladenosine(37)-N6)-methyltransferase TrmO [Moraxella catarrhalis]MPX81323.1 tRNA (N6-threonylcarbamoyladenosine(37)-N6)-methyltransferase TrmO [Moraxella catarrhalis]
MTMITFPIIGYHHSPLTQKFGIPRQPNLVQVSSHIEFVPPYDNVATFEGIENYSHLWIIWQFHHNRPQANFRPQVRPPRFGGNAKMGVFATRSMYRPSPLGLSVVRLERLEVINHKVRLYIIGADMADGTPIFDIKPYLAFSDSITDAISQQIDTPSMRKTAIDTKAKQVFDGLIRQGVLEDADVQIIQGLIAQDPRPAYRQDEVGTIFALRYDGVDVDFLMNETGVLMIVGVRLIGS